MYYWGRGGGGKGIKVKSSKKDQKNIKGITKPLMAILDIGKGLMLVIMSMSPSTDIPASD